MSKRANETQDLVSENKRSRSSTVKEGHVPDCTDELCKGCDVVEVEISFVRKDADGKPIDTEPSAQELLSMAIDEASNDKNNDSDEENNGIARRLFDMAIEKYQKDEPENRVGYATCLIELGKAIRVEESISEGLEVLRGELKTKKDDKDILLKTAGAAIALAASIRKKHKAYMEEVEAELGDPDDEIDDDALEELEKKYELSKEEIKLYKEAIECFNEAFADVQHIDETFLKEAQTVMHEMRGYGQLFEVESHKDHSDAVLNAVIAVIQKLPDYENNDELLLLWASSLLHQEKFLPYEQKPAYLKKADELLIKSNKLYLAKNGKENPWVWELYAMLRINQSMFAQDEEAVELYDDAILSFKKASALSPDNTRLAHMVIHLQNMQKEMEEYEEDLEENVGIHEE
ncbi:hypothetical protein [Parasitella parasitica]|uniref:Uncharacterized protein n=1 Tax=Parasitella parasitica TaxID=35722 RepID=A0A0B7NV22_9FUNG|nr:hypothetical protein [Parasitella parasitica]